MQRPSADFPMLGRAATMIRLPGLEAGGEPVEVAEAGRHAGDVDAGLVQRRDPLEALLEQRLDVGELGRDALPARGRRRSARRGRRGRSSRPAGPSRGARSRRPRGSGRAASPSRGRSARSGRRSRSARDERRELVDAARPPTRLELAALLELVDERDRVDRLALRVERRAPRGRSSRGSRGRSRPRRATSLTAPIAPGESIIAPRTDSSASRFCGGTGADARSGGGAGRPAAIEG